MKPNRYLFGFKILHYCRSYLSIDPLSLRVGEDTVTKNTIDHENCGLHQTLGFLGEESYLESLKEQRYSSVHTL